MALLWLPFLLVIMLVLGSVGSGLYLLAQWAAWHRQGREHKTWSRPLVAGWGLLAASLALLWLCQNLSGDTTALYALTFTVFCAALVTWPYAMGRYRETLAALNETPRYDDPQEGVWPPPPTNRLP